MKTAQGDFAYVGVPAFVSRAFRHTSIYVRTDRVKKPQDLKGKQDRRAGISTHRQCLGARDAGGRIRRQAVGHPLDARRDGGGRARREDRDHAAGRREARERAGGHDAQRDAGGRRDRRLHRAAHAVAASSRTSRMSAGCLPIRWRQPKDYFKRKTGIFPIMHIVGVRRTLADAASLAAGRGAQGVRAVEGEWLALLEETSASKVTLPFMEEQVKAARDLMGEDFWPYGIPANRKTARILPRAAPQAGTVVPAGEGGGPVPPDDVRAVQVLARHRRPEVAAQRPSKDGMRAYLRGAPQVRLTSQGDGAAISPAAAGRGCSSPA